MQIKLTKEQVIARLQHLSGRNKNRGILNGVAYILSGDFDVTENTKQELSEKLQRIAKTLIGEDFVTVVNAIVYLIPDLN